jgi:hypothetical protein
MSKSKLLKRKNIKSKKNKRTRKNKQSKRMKGGLGTPTTDIRDFLLTLEDIGELPVTFNPDNFNAVFQKITGLRNSGHIKIDHNINTDTITDIYCTSDVHADYQKLVQCLFSGGFISNPHNLDVYEDNNVFDPRIITDSIWLKENTLFIIIGDLINGVNRVPGSSLLNDTNGSFELLLFMLLYNLRIKARSKGSEILFTIGNHDIDGIMDNAPFSYPFIHPNALTYFHNPDIRSETLRHFYTLSPYLFLNVNTKLNTVEILCTHAGIHSEHQMKGDNYNIGEEYNMVLMNKLQNQINRNPEKLTEPYRNIKNNRYVFLQTRYYAEIKDIDDCRYIESQKYKYKYKFIVVGHCTTRFESKLKEIIMSDTQYDSCEKYESDNKTILEGRNKGCILFDQCRDENGLPTISFIDTAQSDGYRLPSGKTKYTNKNRNIEYLHLHRGPPSGDRDFNIITKLELGEGTNNDIVFEF